MKTIKNKKNEIKRVDEKEAEILVGSKNWKYIPKSEWKKIRNFIKTDAESIAVKKEKKKNQHDIEELKNKLYSSKSKSEKRVLEKIIKKEH